MGVDDFALPEETVRRAPPVNLRQGDQWFFASEHVRHFPAVRAKRLERIAVHADGLCYRSGRRVAWPVLVYPPGKLGLRHYAKGAAMVVWGGTRDVFDRLQSEVPHAVLLTDLYLGGFFHWCCDVLPKLQALATAGVDLSRELALVPACRNAGYVAESLAAFGVPHCVVDPAAYITVNRLCAIPRLAPTGNYRPAVMVDLRDTMRRFVSAGDGSSRIYITRRDAGKRRLLNEGELLPILEQHGFQVVCMEDHDFATQVRIVAEAKTLVSMHGAGLAHMVWMKPDAQVLEIREASDPRSNCYYALASALGHEYHYLLSHKTAPWVSGRLADAVVDAGGFDSALAFMLGGETRRP